MPSLLVKAEDLAAGDVLLHPFQKSSVVTEVLPFGPKATYVHIKTSYVVAGEVINRRIKLERTQQVNVEARVI